MKLKNICSIITDGSHFSPLATQDGYPMLSVKDMREFDFDRSVCKKISRFDFDRMIKNGCVPQKGDVLVAKDGSYLKEIFVCKENREEAILSSIAIFRPNQKIIDSKYLCYVLKTPQIYNYIKNNCVSGSALPRIILRAFKEVEIPVPDLLTQRKIATALSAIDDKIELNNKLNIKLEQIAVTIFKNKFHGYRNGDNCIGDYILPTRGKNLLSRNFVRGTVPVIAGGLKPAGYHNKANTNSPVITISSSGANAGFVNLWMESVWSSDSSFIDSKMTESIYFWYILLKMRQNEIFDAQTGSAQPHIYPQHIAGLPIGRIDKKRMHQYSDDVSELFAKMKKNTKENEALIQLRDSLLPKLMSGEIDVSKVEI